MKVKTEKEGEKREREGSKRREVEKG